MLYKMIVATAIASLAGVLLTSSAHAQDNNEKKNQNSPTYQVHTVACKGSDCRAIVMNEHGWGVTVEGTGKKKTKKKADKKAEELNEAAASGNVESVVDTCLTYPELCP